LLNLVTGTVSVPSSFLGDVWSFDMNSRTWTWFVSSIVPLDVWLIKLCSKHRLDGIASRTVASAPTFGGLNTYSNTFFPGARTYCAIAIFMCPRYALK